MSDTVTEKIEKMFQDYSLGDIVGAIEEYSHLRGIADITDTFLETEGEREYKDELVNNENFLDILDYYRQLPVDKLVERLVGDIHGMEDFQVAEEDEGKVEVEVMACCLALNDYIKRLVKVKIMDDYSTGGEVKKAGR